MGKGRKQQQSKRLRDNAAARAKYGTPARQYPAPRGREGQMNGSRPIILTRDEAI